MRLSREPRIYQGNYWWIVEAAAYLYAVRRACPARVRPMLDM
jgi:hypothetical protein